jgi:peptidoglycan/LPS O-acetylase OafA/YrhL
LITAPDDIAGAARQDWRAALCLWGLAVAVLVAFHAVPDLLPAGRLGFDLALAAAGYVVTRRLLTDGVATARVWADLLLWATPPFVLVAALVLVGGLFLLPPAELADQGRVTAWTAAGLGGEVLRHRAGYDPALADELLGPAFVLGVAAQLALGWTVVLWALRRAGRSGWALPLALASALASLALDLYWRRTGLHVHADYLAPARGWGFLLGAVLAASGLVGTRDDRHGLRDPAGLGALLLAVWLWSWPLLLWPRMVLARSLSLPEMVASLLAAIALALLGQRLIEPLIRRSRERHARAIFASVAALGAVGLAGLALVALGGLPGRASPGVLQEAASAQKRPTLQALCVVDLDPRLPPAEACTVPRGASADIVLWGNSHADHISPAVFDWAASRRLAVRQAAQSGCLPLIEAVPKLANPACAGFNRAALSEWGRTKPRMVVLGAGWTVVLEQEAAGAQQLDRLTDDLRATVRALRAAIGPDARIVLLGNTPDYAFAPARCHAQRAFLGLDTERCDRARPANRALAAAVDARLAGIAASEPGVSLFRPWDALCDGELCRTRGADGAWYADRNHLTEAGGRAQTVALAALLDGGAG